MTVFSAFIANTKQTGLELKTALSGLYSYYSRGEADQNAWSSLLPLHCPTNGRSSDRLARLLRIMRPARSVAPASGLLGNFSAAEIKDIAAVLACNGYYVFERRLSAGIC